MPAGAITKIRTAVTILWSRGIQTGRQPSSSRNVSPKDVGLRLAWTRSVRLAESLQEQAALTETPFDSIESAQQFLTLLTAQVAGVRTSLTDDVAAATRANARRRLDALRLVEYKLTQLDQHLSVAVRLLNDLRALRRLLLGERNTPVVFDVSAASHDVR